MNTHTNQLADVPLPELRRMLRETERAAGRDSQGAVILRRLICTREAAQQKDAAQ